MTSLVSALSIVAIGLILVVAIILVIRALSRMQKTNWIDERLADFGTYDNPPSLEEIGEHFGLSSVATAGFVWFRKSPNTAAQSRISAASVGFGWKPV